MTGAYTILIVDDEFGVAEVLEAVVKGEGYHVVSAINGKQGLARLDERSPDLIMLDYMMPIMHSRAMLAALKADPATAYR